MKDCREKRIADKYDDNCRASYLCKTNNHTTYNTTSKSYRQVSIIGAGFLFLPAGPFLWWYGTVSREVQRGATK